MSGTERGEGRRAMPRHWRWLVVLHDLPPMPKRSEVVWGYLTKRSAEHEATMLRIDVVRAVR